MSDEADAGVFCALEHSEVGSPAGWHPRAQLGSGSPAPCRGLSSPLTVGHLLTCAKTGVAGGWWGRPLALPVPGRGRARGPSGRVPRPQGDEAGRLAQVLQLPFLLPLAETSEGVNAE